MVIMPKENICKYLKMYAVVMNKAFKEGNGSIPIYNVYESLYNLGEEEYNKMLDAVKTYYTMKYFSITEDYLLNRDNFLDNDKLDDMDGLYKLTQTTNQPIQNKKILVYLRNAFNHSNECNNSSYNISPNGKVLEVAYEDVRTGAEINASVPKKPISIRVSADNLYKISNIMSANEKNFAYLSLDVDPSFDFNAHNLYSELDKVKFIHYYFPNNISETDLNTFKEYKNYTSLDNNQIRQFSDSLKLQAANLGYSRTFELDNIQKKKIVNDIKLYKEKWPNIFIDTIPTLYDFVLRVFPLPGLKHQDLLCQLTLINLIRNDKGLSRDFILDGIENMIDQNINTNCSEYLRFYKLLHDGNFTQAFPVIMYIDSYITSIYNHPTISINGKVYQTSHIRNSLVHARWFINEKNELVLYDAHPKSERDMDLSLVLCVPLNILYNDINRICKEETKVDIPTNVINYKRCM